MRRGQHQQPITVTGKATRTVLPLAAPTANTLLISTNITKNPIIHGDTQKITIAVFDAVSNLKAVGAKLNGKVSDTNGLANKEFENITGLNGQVAYSWKIEKIAKPGLFIVRLNASAAGYEPKSATTAFEVSPDADSSTVHRHTGIGAGKDHRSHSTSSGSITRVRGKGIGQ
jgi:hypothetical protein